MPVTDVAYDLEACTITITAEFAAPLDRIWLVYADPRQLERVFGPPGYPATFEQHELRPGGESHYFMTSPDGDRHYGWWRVTAVDEPRRFTFDDGFAVDDTYAPSPDLPVSTNVYAFEPTDGGTKATFTSTYESADALQKVLDMGVVEGASSAINQLDGILAA